MEEQARQLNIIGLPEDIAPIREYEVWSEHVQVLGIFLACDDQWRTGPNGVLGLDLGVVLQFCDLYNVEDRRQLMADLRVITDRARELINSREG